MKSPCLFACRLACAGLIASIPSLRAQEEVVSLSEFTVEESSVSGYRAGTALSATRTNVAIRDLPVSLQVFTEEFIADQLSSDLDDVVRFASGVTKSGAAGFTDRGTAEFTLRGFQTPFVLRNGFRRTQLVDTTNIERVEVVKGPASLLYGQIQPGGVINYVTKRPQFTAQQELNVRVGSYDLYRAQLNLTGPIGTGGKLAYRLDASAGTRQAVEWFYQQDDVFVSPSLLWRPAPRTEIRFEYEHVRRDTTGPIGASPLVRLSAQDVYFYPLPREFNIRNPNMYADRRMNTALAEVLHQFNDHFSLRSATSYAEQRQARLTGGSAEVTNFRDPSPGPIPRMVRRSTALNVNDSDNLFNQTELLGKFRPAWGELTVLSGFEYRKEETYAFSMNDPLSKELDGWNLEDPGTWTPDIAPFPEAYDVATTSRTDTEAKSAYAVLQVALLENRLRVLGGWRYDTFETSSFDVLRNVSGDPESGSRWTPQVGAIFRLTPAIGLYATYSESYLPLGGSFVDRENALRRDRNEIYTTRPYAPQIGEGFDIGVKMELLNERVTVTASTYRIDFTNIARLIQERPHPESVNLATLDYQVQSGVERSEGFEVDFVASLTRSFQLLGGYSYMDAFVLSNDQQPQFTGLSLANAPKHMASLWGKYTWREGRWRGLSLGGGVQYVGKRRAIERDTTDFFLDSYTVVDLMAGYDTAWFGRPTSLTLSAKNVLDTFYRKTRFEIGQPLYLTGSVTIKF